MFVFDLKLDARERAYAYGEIALALALRTYDALDDDATTCDYLTLGAFDRESTLNVCADIQAWIARVEIAGTPDDRADALLQEIYDRCDRVKYAARYESPSLEWQENIERAPGEWRRAWQLAMNAISRLRQYAC